MEYSNTYDVIVVGGGHAGTEAALASAALNQRHAMCASVWSVFVESTGKVVPVLGSFGGSYFRNTFW